MDNIFVIVLVTLFTTGILTLLYMLYEATNLKVTHIKYNKDAAKDSVLKIMNISDIHIKFLRVSPEKIAKHIRENNPDIVLLSGDYIENTSYSPLFIEFLKRSGITDKPCYGVFGNHDYEAMEYDEDKLQGFIRLMKTNGLHILCDESIKFEKNKVIYNIIGLKDLREMKPDYAKAYSNLDITAKMNIVITHNPDTVLKLPANKTDLILAGHFHGGQIWLPFKLEYKVFRDEELCMMNISRGMHHVNGIDIYINRGLGNVVVPMRFLSRPEILFIEV